jgi:hypothetical protein
MSGRRSWEELNELVVSMWGAVERALAEAQRRLIESPEEALSERMRLTLAQAAARRFGRDGRPGWAAPLILVSPVQAASGGDWLASCGSELSGVEGNLMAGSLLQGRSEELMIAIDSYSIDLEPAVLRGPPVNWLETSARCVLDVLAVAGQHTASNASWRAGATRWAVGLDVADKFLPDGAPAVITRFVYSDYDDEAIEAWWGK